MWSVNILTTFPQLFPGPLGLSVIGRSLVHNIWQLSVYDIRDFATDKHRTVDDAPYGGGRGMVLCPDVTGAAIESVFLPNNNPILYMSPRGQVFNQRIARKFSEQSGVNILCGRFEGVDERVINEYMISEISIGDFLLSAGDVAAMIMVDACVRLLPGVLKNCQSLAEESFGMSTDYENLLEYPQYTRPSEWKGHKVPGILLSGAHGAIKTWRLEQAKLKTQQARPDLWNLYLRRVR